MELGFLRHREVREVLQPQPAGVLELGAGGDLDSADRVDGFAEFGGAVGRKKSVKRPFIKSGRSLYPAFKRRYLQVIEAAQEGLADLAKESGLEVS